MGEDSIKVQLERERLQFCEKMYELEKLRGDLLERKAQLHFAVLSVIIGLFSVNIQGWSKVRAFVDGLWLRHPSWCWALVIETGACAASVAALFGSIVLVYRPRRREKPYPPALVSRLFERSPCAETEEALAALIRANAMRYALAVENNSRVNTAISRWLLRASAAVLSCLLLLATLGATAVVAYLRF